MTEEEMLELTEEEAELEATIKSLLEDDWYLQLRLGMDRPMKEGGWAAEMDEMDNLYMNDETRERRSELFEKARVFKTKAGSSGKHVGAVIKKDKIRKESPWTCSKCGLLHSKGGYNCESCGYALVREKDYAKTKRAAAKTVTATLPELVADQIQKYVERYLDKRFAAVESVTQHLEGKTHVVPIYPKLEITKSLAQEINSQTFKADDFNPLKSTIHVAKDGAVNKVKPLINEKKSLIEGSVVLDKGVEKVGEVVVKRKNRRRAKDPKKETKEFEKIPLNLKSPPQGGVIGSLKLSQNSSPKSQLCAGKPHVHSMGENRKQ